MPAKERTSSRTSSQQNRRLQLGAFVSVLALLGSIYSIKPAQANVVQVDNRSQLGNSCVPVRQWFDNSIKTKAIVVALHGAARHSGTFQPLAEQLAAQGFLVACPDMRGHGDWYFSAKSDSDKVADYEGSTTDATNLIKQLHREHPLLPIFCVGESAGAAVAIKVACAYPALNGLVLSAIGTKPCLHDMQNLVKDVFVGALHFDQPLPVTRSSLSKYSSDDAKVREAAAADPLIKPGLSARELIRTSMLLNRTGRFAAQIPDHIPVLMLQGKEDQIVEASSAEHVLKRIHSREKSIVEFPTGHILLSTPYLRADVVGTLSDWLTARSGDQQTAVLHDATSMSAR